MVSFFQTHTVNKREVKKDIFKSNFLVITKKFFVFLNNFLVITKKFSVFLNNVTIYDMVLLILQRKPTSFLQTHTVNNK